MASPHVVVLRGASLSAVAVGCGSGDDGSSGDNAGHLRRQDREIETMQSIEAELGGVGGDGQMSGDEHLRGMDSDAPMLKDAEPFDRVLSTW